MARKRSKRRGRLFVPRVSESIALGALASNTLIKADFANTLDQECWAISMDVEVIIHDFTAGNGPVVFGVAHGDYEQQEIEEWLEANGSWKSSDKIEQEQARRKCRLIGTFDLTEQQGQEKFREGQVVRVKLGFKIEDGETLSLWAYNDGTAVMTTGALLEMKGMIYFKPL